MAVIGHTFSIFLKFRGGKGVATGLGAILGLAPLVALIAVVTWGVVLLLTRMVSAASIVACVAAPLAAWLWHIPMAYFYAILLLTTVAFLKHIPNMKRIISGTEPKVRRKPTQVEEETFKQSTAETSTDSEVKEETTESSLRATRSVKH